VAYQTRPLDEKSAIFGRGYLSRTLQKVSCAQPPALLQ